MIMTAIVNIIYSILQFITSPFPSIPGMSQGIMDTANAVVSAITSSVAVMAFILSAPLIAFIFITYLAVLNFHWIHALFIWVIKKIPALGLK